MSTPDEPERSTDPVLAEPLRPAAEPSPSDPVAAADAAAPVAPGTVAATFAGRTPSGPGRLRIGVISGAAVALAVGAVATSLAAAPGPDATGGAPTTDSGWLAPAAPAIAGPLSGDEAEAFDHGRSGARGGFGEITITAIDGSTVTLETADGWTRTVTITDDVDLTKAGQDIDPSDLAVGDQVRLRQSRHDDGTFTVEALAVVVPSVGGNVSDVTDASFKITTRDGSVWTIATDGSTTYRLGAVPGARSDLTEGDIVRVQGDATGDNALRALEVRIAVERTLGRVTATTDSTITLQARQNASVTVHVDGDTVYRVAGEDEATIDDITVGMIVAIQGTTRADGSIDADAVTGGRLGLRGEGDGDGPGFRDRGLGGPGGPLGGFGDHGDHGPRGDGDESPDPTPSAATGS